MFDVENFEQIIIDACIMVSIFLEEKNSAVVSEFIGINALTGKLAMNEINLFEVRYILKSKGKSNQIDEIIDQFIEDCAIKIYKNTTNDFKIGSDFKSEGGISPYDALMLAQITNSGSNKTLLLTTDQEFNKPKFTDKFSINFLG